MKRILFAVMCLALASPALAQYRNNVQLTIDTTAAGIGFTANDILPVGHPQVNSASCTSNSTGGDFRYRVDGTAPTTTVGVLVPAGGAVIFADTSALLSFRGIRTAGVSAVLSCTLSDRLNLPPVYPVGGAGGGSGGTSFDGVLLDAAAGDPITDTVNDALRVNIVAGAVGGSGGTSAADNSAFTFGTTLLTPTGYVFDDVAPNAVTENRTASPRMAANRVPYAILRDAAGNERGALVTAANELLVELGAGTAAIGSLTAGSASIGTLGANSGVDIGDVTINNAAGAAAVNIQDGGNSLTVDGTVTITDGAGAVNVICDSGCSGGTQYTQDAALTVATTVGTMAMGRASATAPTDVTADNDAVMPWYLRSGALVNQPTFGGVLASAGNGASGTGVQRVTIANDSTGVFTGTLANDGVVSATNRVPTLPGITENAAPTRTDGRNAAISMTTGGATRVMITNAAGTATTIATDATLGTTTYTEATSSAPGLVYRNDTPDALVNTTNEATPLGVSQNGALWVTTIDPCSYLAKTVIPISIATATTTELTAALAGASNFYYVCSINLGPTAGAQNFALVDDDSDGCGSVTAGMAGGTTAGSGWNFPANGGLTFGNGAATIMKTNGTNRVICAVTSAAQQVSGSITVVAAP